jgi:1-acyl-sn-glycerol-3-phosphate acyltransferase
LISFTRGLIFYFGYVISIIFYSVFVTPFAWLLLPFKQRYSIVTSWIRFLGWWLKITCGIRYELENPQDLPKELCVVVANHQSSWETFFLQQYFAPQCVAAKKELMYIPFVGFTLRALNPVVIDRSKKQNALKQLIQQGKERLNDGVSVLIFPEGTRVHMGETKPHFAGGAMLAIKAETGILPIAHNAGLYWPPGRISKFPGTIKIRVGQLTQTKDRKPKELSQQLEEWIRVNSGELCHQSNNPVVSTH